MLKNCRLIRISLCYLKVGVRFNRTGMMMGMISGNDHQDKHAFIETLLLWASDLYTHVKNGAAEFIGTLSLILD